MNTNDLLLKCCALIEQKLSWGDSANWQNQDFETLSDRIFEQTQVVLSVSTLKRVWGKVKYDSLPSITTLNTLAAFAGYEHWRAFRIAHEANGYGHGDEAKAPDGAAALPDSPPMPGPPHANNPPGHPFTSPARPAQRMPEQLPGRGNPSAHRLAKKRSGRPALYIIPIILAVLALAGWMYRKSASVKPGEYSFTSQPLAAGIPNSVVFTYNADAAGSDSVFIQQSWDPRRRFSVPAGGRTYTSMYYYPGFFLAKLVVGKQVVKEHGLLIPSNGWLAAVHQEPVPVYFTPQEAADTGVFHIPAALLQQKNIPLQPKLPEIRYYNIGADMQGLQNDNFIFETTVKSEFGQGSAACRRANVLVHCENAAFIIPLTIPGCVGEIGLMLPEKGYGPQHANLSGFGCDMSQWVQLRCEVRNKHLQIWVNDKKAWTDTLTDEARKIVGVSYRFEGPGAVDNVKFSRLNGTAVFEDTFE